MREVSEEHGGVGDISGTPYFWISRDKGIEMCVGGNTFAFPNTEEGWREFVAYAAALAPPMW